MTETRAEITINRSPSDVWDVVGDPHSIIDWVPGVESCEIVGDRRTAVLRGNELTERFHVDHAERRVTLLHPRGRHVPPRISTGNREG